MKLEIVWSQNAESTFDAIYQFVMEQWGIEIAEKMRFQTLKLLNQISEYPFSFQESLIKNVRKVVVSKYTSFFYEVFIKYILLVFFWDNWQQTIF